MKAERSGQARVFLGDVPESGVGHEGLRGPIRLDDLGVHFYSDECEWLTDGCTEWESLPERVLTTIPLHRVFLVEWVPEPELAPHNPMSILAGSPQPRRSAC